MEQMTGGGLAGWTESEQRCAPSASSHLWLRGHTRRHGRDSEARRSTAIQHTPGLGLTFSQPLKMQSAVTTRMVGRKQEVDRKRMTQSASCTRNHPSSRRTQKYEIYTRFSKSCLVGSCWMTLTHWWISQLIGPSDVKEIDQVFLISSPERGVKARHTRVSNLLLQVTGCRVGR